MQVDFNSLNSLNNNRVYLVLIHLEVFNSQHLILSRVQDSVDCLVNRVSKLQLYHYRTLQHYLVSSPCNRICHFNNNNNNNNFLVHKVKVHYLVVHSSNNNKINYLEVYRRVLRCHLCGDSNNNNNSLRFKDLVLLLVVVVLWVNRVVQMIL